MVSPKISHPNITEKTGDKKLKEATEDAGYIFINQNQIKKPKLPTAKIWNAIPAICIA